MEKDYVVKYRDLRFKTNEEFQVWLVENTWLTIHLKDNGQDLLKMEIASNNEVINCNQQGGIWNGSFVVDAEVGEPLRLFTSIHGAPETKDYDFIVEKIVGIVEMQMPTNYGNIKDAIR